MSHSCIINVVTITSYALGLTLLSLNAGGQGRHITQPPQAPNPSTPVRRLPAPAACCLGQGLPEHQNHLGAGRGGGIRTVPYIIPYPVYVDSRDYQGLGQSDPAVPADSTDPQSPETPPFRFPSTDEIPFLAPVEPIGPQSQFAAPEPSCPAAAPLQNSVDPVEALIALKDHRVHVAVAYWLLGDTLHYITPFGIHNQVSLRLVDRSLTSRLNADRLLQLVLPPD